MPYSAPRFGASISPGPLTRQRTLAVSDLAGFCGADRAVGGMLRMRCSWRARGRRVALVTGPVLSTRVRPAACAIIAVCDQYQTPPHPGLMT